MPMLSADDGVELYYEETGSGTPVVFVHEFAGDHRSYEPQVRYFNRRVRCITFNARGYPPSTVPEALGSYSQEQACEDIRAVLDALDIEKAHLVGISMGAFAVIHFGLTYPNRAFSLVAGGCGYGAPHNVRVQFKSEAQAMANRIIKEGMGAVRLLCDGHPSAVPAEGPTRLVRIQGDAHGAFRTRLRQHHARHPGETPLFVRLGKISLKVNVAIASDYRR